MSEGKEKDYSNFTPEGLAEHCTLSTIRKMMMSLSPREQLFSAVLGDLSNNHLDKPMRVRLEGTLKELKKSLESDLQREIEKDTSNSPNKEQGILAGTNIHERIVGEPRVVLDAAICMTESPNFTYYHALSQQLDLMKESRRVLMETCIGAMDFFEYLLVGANDREMAEAYWTLVMSKAFITCLRKFGEYFALNMLVDRAKEDYEKLSDLKKFKATNLDTEVRAKYFAALGDLHAETQAVKVRITKLKEAAPEVNEFEGIEDLDSILDSIEKATLAAEEKEDRDNAENQ